MSADEHSNSHDNGHGNESVRFEPTDVSTRPVALSVLALAIFTVLFTVVAHYVFMGLAERERAASPPASPLAEKYAIKQPPEPRLQLDPKKDLDVLREAEHKALSTLAWVDRNAGIVQVPIERAMQMLLAKGLPARQGPVPQKMAPQGVAPAQMGEAAGAPDWTGGWQVSHDKPDHGGGADHGSHDESGSHAKPDAPAAKPHETPEGHGH